MIIADETFQNNIKYYLGNKVGEDGKPTDTSVIFKETIDDGWYIYTDADMFYIDGSDVYNMYHYTHDLMIYGYDEEAV